MLSADVLMPRLARPPDETVSTARTRVLVDQPGSRGWALGLAVGSECWQVFERFTEEARQIVVIAQARARTPS